MLIRGYIRLLEFQNARKSPPSAASMVLALGSSNHSRGSHDKEFLAGI